MSSFVLRWNRRWISGQRFAQDYAATLAAFTSEVAQAVLRVHRSREGVALCDAHTHAVVWAAVLVAFEKASFRDQDREILQALLLHELRTSWGQGELTQRAYREKILRLSDAYFATRDRNSPLKTAEQIVNWYLRAIGMPERVGNSALARHLRANFSHRILGDIYRLSAASRLRTAVVSLMERQRAARIADVDVCGVAIWEEGQPGSVPKAGDTRGDNDWDGHPIEAVVGVGQ